MMNDLVVHIRLINGDDLIGVLIEHNENSIVLADALIIDSMADESGNSRAVLSNYNPFAEINICELRNDHVISILSVHPEVRRYYSLSKQLNDQNRIRLLEDVKQTNIVLDKALNQPIKQEVKQEENQKEDNVLAYFSSNTIH